MPPSSLISRKRGGGRRKISSKQYLNLRCLTFSFGAIFVGFGYISWHVATDLIMMTSSSQDDLLRINNNINVRRAQEQEQQAADLYLQHNTDGQKQKNSWKEGRGAGRKPLNIPTLKQQRQQKQQQQQQQKPQNARQSKRIVRYNMTQIENRVKRVVKDNPKCHDKGHFLKLLFQGMATKKVRQAYKGIRLPNLNNRQQNQQQQIVHVDNLGNGTNTYYSALCDQLPTETQVNEMYGSEAVIYGMETCETYRNMLKQPAKNNGRVVQPKPRVAGLYHTGTNGLCRTFTDNIQKLPPNKKWNPYEIPWGKHLPPATHRLNNTFPPDNKEDRFCVLPIVIVKDPYTWMQSMCKWNYDAKWEKAENNRCPNLIRFPHNKTTYKMNVKTHQTKFTKTDYYDSLVDTWSDWYSQYYNADYPRLMIRFEDILYHQEDMIRKVRECIGMDTDLPFLFETKSPKWHGNPTEFTAALKKYGTESLRRRGLNDDDRQYAREKLSSELMSTFHYNHIPSKATLEDLQGPFLGWENPAPDNSLARKKVGYHVLDQFREKNLGEKMKDHKAKMAEQRRAIMGGGVGGASMPQ